MGLNIKHWLFSLFCYYWTLEGSEVVTSAKDDINLVKNIWDSDMYWFPFYQEPLITLMAQSDLTACFMGSTGPAFSPL